MTDLLARVHGRLSYANITATLALFIALGGGAYAASSLPHNSVGSAQLRKHAVTASKIRHGAVRSDAIRDRSIRLRDISTSARASLRGQTGAQGPAGPAGTALSAAINSGGQAMAGNSQSGSHVPGTNEYTVVFGRDVSKCVYAATLAAVPNGATVEQPPAGRITVATAGAGSVLVRTFDASGAAAPEPFHLLVSC